MNKSTRTYYFLPGEVPTNHTDGTGIDYARVATTFDELCLVDPEDPQLDKEKLEQNFYLAGYKQFPVRVFHTNGQTLDQG